MHRLLCVSLIALCAIALSTSLEIDSSVRFSNARVFRSDLEEDGVTIEPNEVYAIHVAGDAPFRFKVSCGANPDVSAVVVRAVNSVRGLRTVLAVDNFPTADDFAWTSPVHPDTPLVVTSSDAQWPSEQTFYGLIFNELNQAEAKMHLHVLCLSEDLTEYAMILNDPSIAAAKEQVVAEIMNVPESVEVARPESATQLSDGIPVAGNLAPGATAYYVFFPQNPGCNLSFSVTPLYGDPDLYVSTHTMTPGPKDYDAKSTNFGGDSVIFTPESTGPYYVGVYSFTSTAFNVMANEQCPKQFVYLQDGVPIRDIVTIGSYALYAFNVNTSISQLRIDLQSIVGDADLYVSIGQIPNTTSYTWASTSFGSDSITITWPYYPGQYIIAVYGFTNITQFSIAVTTSSAVEQLSNGVPAEGSLAPGQATYYSANWNFNLSANLLLHLDVLAISGDPDVYVSTSYAYPNSYNYMWKSERFLSESLTIPVTYGACISTPCIFYIGIYAANNNATRFTVTGSYNTVVRLVDGVPTSTNLASAGEAQYYALDVARTLFRNDQWNYPNVTFSIAPLFGYTNVYISCSGLPDPSNSASFQGYIPYYQGQGSFNIDPSQYPACASKVNDTTGTMTIFAGVVSFSGNTSFLLTASTGDSHTTLLEGVPYRGQLANYQTASFDFFNSYAGGVANVQISLTALSGDPDLFVCSPRIGHPEFCNAANADYRSTRTGDDVITITAAPGGEYVIAVYGFSNCTFVLALSSNTNSTSSFSVLQDGVPMSAAISPNAYAYFEYYVQPSHQDITISVEAMMGSVSTFVTTDGSIPSASNYQYHSDNSSITIPSYVGGGQNFLIGLYGYMYSTVMITASQVSNTSMVMLSENMPFSDYTTGWKYYQFYQSHNDSFTVDLTMYYGSVMVYVGKNPFPSMYNSTWQSWIGSSGQISISNTDYNFCAYCYYYIGVQPSMSSNASYSITVYDKAASNSSISLINNMAFDDDVSAGTYKYYSFANPSYPVNMWFTILVNTYATNVTAYVSPNNLPTSTNYVYYAAGGTDKPIRVVIPQNDPSGCRPYDSSCTYFIGVFGTSNCNYTILAQAKY